MNYNNKNFFIDWIALYIPFIPYCTLERQAEWTSTDHDFYKVYVDNKIDEYLFNYSPHYKLLHTNHIKPWNIMHTRKSVRLEFRGSFFEGQNIKEDILNFYKIYQKIQTFLMLKGKVKLSPASIFRLDVSTNINQKLMTKRNTRRFKTEYRVNKEIIKI